MGIFLLVVAILLFIGLVVVHEWGHFIAARRAGVVVEEFSIFFPPRLYKRKTKGGWLFSISLLPLGGFVKLKGEHDSDTGKGSYGAAKTSAKVKIMLAGVFMNLVVALVLFTVLAWVGMPKLIDNQFTVKSDTKVVNNQVLISYVEPGSPAAKAGLQVRDQIFSIDYNSKPRAIHSSQDLLHATSALAGKYVKIDFTRDGHRRSAFTKLLSDAQTDAAKKAGKPKGHLGVEPTEFTMQRSTWSAPIVAVGLSAQITGLTYQGLGHALGGLGGIIAGAFTHNHAARENAQSAASEQVAGPVGIFVVLKDGSLLGYQFMLMIIAVISLTLAIMNVLPIPALDGGRLFVTFLSRLIRKQISARAEEAIYGTGFAILMLLVILISVVDVKRFF